MKKIGSAVVFDSAAFLFGGNMNPWTIIGWIVLAHFSVWGLAFAVAIITKLFIVLRERSKA